jgi:hypothetical protein
MLDALHKTAGVDGISMPVGLAGRTDLLQIVTAGEPPPQ